MTTHDDFRRLWPNAPQRLLRDKTARELLCQARQTGPLLNEAPGLVAETRAIAAITAALQGQEGREAQSYAEWQQRRGRAVDLIDWIVSEFDDWMTDDDYDTRGCLDRIVARCRRFRDEAALAHPDPAPEGEGA